MNIETKLIINYFSAWFWHIIAVFFLAIGIIAAMLNKYPYLIGGLLIMGAAEYMAIKRQKEFYEVKDEHIN